jgi:hypothetical protein
MAASYHEAAKHGAEKIDARRATSAGRGRWEDMTLDAIDRRQRATHEDPSDTEVRTSAPPKPAPWRQDVPVTTNDPVDLGDVFKNMLAHPDADAVMFLGMNTDSANVERTELAKRANVLTLASDLNANEHKVTFGGRTFDVAPKFGADERPAIDPATSKPSRSEAEQLFVAMGMPRETAARIAQRLDSLDKHAARKELVEAAAVLWQGEQGATIPSRFLISGHSGDGAQAWGSGSNHFYYAELRFIARELPRGAAQIEDFQIGTCSSLNNVTLDLAEWRGALPNLKTVWVYENGAGLHPTGDQAEWERQTRGHSDTFTTTRAMADKHVVTWSARDDKIRGLSSASHLLDERTIANRSIAGAWRGERVDPAALDRAYRVYREVEQRADVDPGVRSDSRKTADSLLRLRYYDAVATNFQRAHAREIAALSRAAGVPAPDFSRLTRKEAIAAIKQLEIAKPEDDLPRAALSTLKLLISFRELEPSAIPESWCQHETRSRRQ